MPRACCKTTEHHGDVACFSRPSRLLCCRLNGGVLRDNPEVTSLIRPINAPSETIGTEGVPDKAHTLDDRRRGGVDSRDHGEPMQKVDNIRRRSDPARLIQQMIQILSFSSCTLQWIGNTESLQFSLRGLQWLRNTDRSKAIQVCQRLQFSSCWLQWLWNTDKPKAFNLVPVNCNDSGIQISRSLPFSSRRLKDFGREISQSLSQFAQITMTLEYG